MSREGAVDRGRIRGYLLRRLGDDERQTFEESYFADDALLDRVEAEEDLLVTDYVLGRLSDEDRRRFEQALLGTPYYRERVETTTRLRRRIARDHKVRSLGRGAPPPLRGRTLPGSHRGRRRVRPPLRAPPRGARDGAPAEGAARHAPGRALDRPAGRRDGGGGRCGAVDPVGRPAAGRGSRRLRPPRGAPRGVAAPARLSAPPSFGRGPELEGRSPGGVRSGHLGQRRPGRSVRGVGRHVRPASGGRSR